MKSLLLAFGAGIWCLWAGATSEAAPVTFRFEAEVASVGMGLPAQDGGVTSSLPFAIQIGDTISATFRFSPSDGMGNYPQFSSLDFSVSDHELSAGSYEISVVNNGIGIVDVPGRMAEPGVAGNIDRQVFLADRISLSCLTSGEPYCGTIESDPELRFIPTIVFEDENVGRLQSENLLADPVIWNSLTGRELSLLFNNRVYVGAYIGLVEAVPEPSTMSCLALSVFVFSFRRFRFCLL